MAGYLATHGAWYTGRNPSEKRQKYNNLKKVYSVASDAAHSGSVKKAEVTLLAEGQAIFRLAILKRLHTEKDPLWDNIVFGR